MDKREEFQLYAQQLHDYIPSYVNTFLCPYCFQEFSPEDLQNGRLTFAHIVSKSIGGREGVLACKDCNSGLGEILDVALKEYFEEQKFLKNEPLDPKTKLMKFYLTINGQTTPVNVELSQTENILGRQRKIRITSTNNPKITNPNAENLISNAILKGWNGEIQQFGIDSNYKKVDERLLRIAVLNMGYLSLFRQFGYAYILSDAAVAIRNQLLFPFEEKLKLPFWINIVEKDFEPTILQFVAEDGTNAPLGFSIYWDTVCVFLPLAEDRDLSIYQRIQNFAELIKGLPESARGPVISTKCLPLIGSLVKEIQPITQCYLTSDEGQKILFFSANRGDAAALISLIKNAEKPDWKAAKAKKPH